MDSLFIKCITLNQSIKKNDPYDPKLTDEVNVDYHYMEKRFMKNLKKVFMFMMQKFLYRMFRFGETRPAVSFVSIMKRLFMAHMGNL